MRYLGIDYGSKRIGIAISDEEGKIAFPHATVDGSDGRAVQTIADLARSEAVGKIIVGLPLSFQGETEQTRAAEAFAAQLRRAVQLPVEFENEILTSKMGEKGGIERKHLDAASAALILQSYLDRITR